MFDLWFPKRWTTIKKLIWLFIQQGNGGGERSTIKGTSPLSLLSALAKPIKSLVQHGKCTVSGSDITCNNGVLKYGAASRNKLDVLSLPTTKNENGITFTINSDGTLTANGTATDRSQIYWALVPAIAKTYAGMILSGELAATGQGDLFMELAGSPYTKYTDTSGNISDDITNVTANVNIIWRVATGVTLENVTLKPMIRLASDPDNTFEPYREGFYTDGTPEEIVVQGENLLDPNLKFSNTTVRGVTLTTEDGYNFHVEGLAESGSETITTAVIATADCIVMPSGQYTIYGATAAIYDTEGVWLYNKNGTFTADEDFIVRYCYLGLAEGTSYNYTRFIVLVKGSTAPTEWTPYHHQTATAEDLYAVDTIEDTQDIITGKVIRRCEPIISDGTTPSGRYIGTVGEGNILVRVKETGYTGAIASFTADEEEPLNGLVCEMSPVQDLHGYDSPWPAGGGGYNKFDPSRAVAGYYDSSGNEASQSTYGEYREEYYIPVDGTQSVVVGYFAYGSPQSEQPWVSVCWYDESKNFISRSADYTALGTFAPPSGGTAKYVRVSMRTFNHGLDYCYMAIGNHTSYFPYENICPISGWQDLTVNQANENLWHSDWTITDGALQKSDGKIICTQNNTTTSYLLGGYTRDIEFYLPKGTYTMLFQSDDFVNLYAEYGDDNTPWYSGLTKTFTEPLHIKTIRCTPQALDIGTYTWKMQITKGSSASPYVPFSGRTIPVKWGALGKNLCDPSVLTLLVNSTYVATVDYATRGAIRVKPNTTYTLSFDSNYSDDSRVFLFNENGDRTQVDGTFSKSKTFTTASDTVSMSFYYKIGSTMSSPLDAKPMLNFGESAETYEPYLDTIYSGTLDLVSGRLRAEKAYALLNNPDKWSETTGNCNMFYLEQFTDRKLFANSYNGLICSYIGVDSNNSLHTGRWLSASDYRFGIKEDSLTLSQVKQDAQAGKISIVYELATPIIYQLTPIEVLTLIGQNNIFSNTNGDTTAYVEGGTTEERVAPQRLSTSEGDNTITVTAEVPNIVFDVTYVKEKDEADVLQSLSILLGGAYRNNFTPDDVSDGEALQILLGR